MISTELGSLFMIFSWSDLIEIFIISLGVHHLSSWLAYDKQKNLLPAFYGYCLLTISAYYAQLSTLTSIACIAAPVILVIFFLIHQNTLQKNFVAMKKNTTQQTNSNAWLEDCMRSALRAVNTGKPLYMLIEGTNNMASFVTCQLPINAPAQHKLLDLLLSSTSYNQNTMLWLTTQGIVLGMNTTWTYELDTTWFDSTTQQLESWQQNALFITKKTDATFVFLEPQHHLFTVIAQGILYEKLRVDQVVTMLSKKLNSSSISLHTRNNTHGSFQSAQSYSQHST